MLYLILSINNDFTNFRCLQVRPEREGGFNNHHQRAMRPKLLPKHFAGVTDTQISLSEGLRGPRDYCLKPRITQAENVKNQMSYEECN